jgi:hypothetical protein
MKDRTISIIVMILVLIIIWGCSSKNDRDIQLIKPDQSSPVSAVIQESTITNENFSAPASSFIRTDIEKQALKALSQDSLFAFLGKTFDQAYADEYYSIASTDPGKVLNNSFDPFVSEYDAMLFSFLSESVYNRLLYSDRLDFNFNSLLNEGLLAIVFRNPYTGSDVKSSLKYAPGDCFISSGKEGNIFIYHSGDKQRFYEPGRDNYDKLTYQAFTEKTMELLTDGRSIINSSKLSADEYSDLLANIERGRQNYFGNNYPLSWIRIWWLNSQMHEIMIRYSFLNEQVPSDISDYLNYFGRKNPSAWVNPYTGSQMQKVSFADCRYFVDRDWELQQAPVPPSFISSRATTDSHAGNYSFDVFDDAEGTIAIFALYFVDENNQLSAFVSRGVSKTRLMKEAWGK